MMIVPQFSPVINVCGICTKPNLKPKKYCTEINHVIATIGSARTSKKSKYIYRIIYFSTQCVEITNIAVPLRSMAFVHAVRCKKKLTCRDCNNAVAA